MRSSSPVPHRGPDDGRAAAPGIVQVYGYGQDAMPDGGTLDYLVMEFVDGTPLSTALRQPARRDPRRVMEIVAEATGGAAGRP